MPLTLFLEHSSPLSSRLLHDQRDEDAAAVFISNLLKMETRSFLEKETNGQAGGRSIHSTSIHDVKRILSADKISNKTMDREIDGVIDV